MVLELVRRDILNKFLASTPWRITLSGIKLGKVEKMFTRQTNQKKKKLKRERETDIHMN